MRPAQRYRENADECERFAEAASLLYVRAMFRELAEHWRRLAHDAERFQSPPQ
jgi:hypothetical protein